MYVCIDTTFCMYVYVQVYRDISKHADAILSWWGFRILDQEWRDCWSRWKVILLAFLLTNHTIPSYTFLKKE